ncbi:MAG TPA: choice-of-anchor D domain-containing protein, partial [Gemmatimonadaceae bacterium]
TTLSIHSDDADEPLVEVELRGEGVEPPVIAVTPPSLYRELLTNQTFTQVLVIGNVTGKSDLTWTLSLQPAPGWLGVTPTSGTIPAGASSNVNVGFDATAMYGGTYDASIIVASNDPVTPGVVVPVRLHVTGVPDITVTPASLGYGSLFIGAVASRTLSVTNNGTDSLVVSSIASDEAAYTAVPATFALAPFGARDVVVSFAPTAPGALPGQLSIASNDPDEGTVTVLLTGTGVVPPVIAVTPRALADTLTIGETSAHTIRVSNSGASNLEIDVVLIDTAPNARVSTARSSSGATANTLPTGIGKGETDTRSYPDMGQHSGGPDPFGYHWRDSNDPGGPVFNWIDASSGVSLFLADDDFLSNIPLGFTFRYYGEQYTAIGVGSNGWLSFNGASTWFPSNVPARDVEAGAIAPYARDLFPPGAAYVRFKTFGVAPHRQFVVEYNQVPDYHGTGPKTFEVIFTETANSIRFQYLQAPNPPIGFGIESPDQTMGMGNTGTGSLFISPLLVTDRYAIEFSGAPEWLAVGPSPATIRPGESLDLAATIDAGLLEAGDHAAIISIHSNDPLNPVVDVAVSLHVIAPAMLSAVASIDLPTRFALSPNYPNPFNPATRIAYDLPRAVQVSLRVYDVGGRQVAELVRGTQPAGRYEIGWDGRNASREPVASGVYFYRLIAGEFVQTRKMVLLK